MNRMEEIEARLNAATPGTWFHEDWRGHSDNPDCRGTGKIWTKKELSCSSGLVCEVALKSPRNGTLKAIERAREINLDEFHANAELIANAPDDLRFLLDRVREMEAGIAHERLRRELLIKAFNLEEGPA